MEIQWYPGHMAKARKSIEAEAAGVDLIIELTDSRTPLSGRNPDIDRTARNKAHILVMTKADLADAEVTAAWARYFSRQGIPALPADARDPSLRKKVLALAREACSRKFEADRRRGIQKTEIRALIAGIPNVGKSTLINTLAGRASAKTGDRPGITKSNQWIRADGISLLDTPGLLWPRFENPKTGLHLAVTGSVRDEILDLSDPAMELLSICARWYPGLVGERYGFSEQEARDDSAARALPAGAKEDTAVCLEFLGRIARSRGCVRNGVTDYRRASGFLLTDFRSGRLGKISLERPEEAEAEAGQ
ncbi:MAG: ribosome biogenesis GTPase YlqF [Lachnospiraceae bacterium]|jgi:ribosome biogenesis GTPase A